MRVNRAKLVRKHLQFFRIVYGIEKACYHIVLDGNFIFAGLKYKVDLKERLKSLLQGADTKLYVLKSVLDELRQVGSKAKGAYDFAASFCEILDDAVFRGENVNDRILAMFHQQHEDWVSAPAKRKKKFFLATQDRELRACLALVPGVPLIYLNKVILVLEPPSVASRDFNLKVESDKAALKPAETLIVENLKKRKNRFDSTIIDAVAARSVQDLNGSSTEEKDPTANNQTTVPLPQPPRKKHKAQGANPLAVIAPSKDSQTQKKARKDRFKR
jgi:U3 small nucleolar RNA-associated protein 23